MRTVDFRGELSERIRAARVSQRYSVRSAAIAASMARDTWAKIEKGLSVHDTSLQAALDLLGLDERGQPLVGAPTQDGGFVRGPGEKSDHGESEDETAAAIRAMRDELRAMAERLDEVSARLGRDEPDSEPLDRSGGEVGPGAGPPADR